MEDRCVCCGEIIPEGTQVCEKCQGKERKTKMDIDEAINRLKQVHIAESYCLDSCFSGSYEIIPMAIEALKFQQEYQAKVQKCIERIDGYIEATYYNSVSGSISDGNKNAAYHNCKNIIKEEMGVEE